MLLNTLSVILYFVSVSGYLVHYSDIKQVVLNRSEEAIANIDVVKTGNLIFSEISEPKIWGEGRKVSI